MPPAARKPCRRRAGRRQPYCCNISGRRRCQSSRNALACGSRAEMKRSYERRCAMTTVPVGMHRDDQRPQIQQAQKPVEGSQFLPNVAKPTERREQKLTRVAFAISRLIEFCSEKELVNQTGHNVEYWPLVILKELFDNALDAAEESARACRALQDERARAPQVAAGLRCHARGDRIHAQRADRA